ncbi:uncharacterized protein LOC111085499 [Limulus polyphemus]|uniref:Uncharacterized protein LOC111085499 n=1 Tax=Limulus polyphemus TaxID=6850 RepID=A0ABM1S8U6_LIMPO|nr:uncharacterized protein LOC111085499 [Limulus polyphemus]
MGASSSAARLNTEPLQESIAPPNSNYEKNEPTNQDAEEYINEKPSLGTDQNQPTENEEKETDKNSSAVSVMGESIQNIENNINELENQRSKAMKSSRLDNKTKQREPIKDTKQIVSNEDLIIQRTTKSSLTVSSTDSNQVVINRPRPQTSQSSNFSRGRGVKSHPGSIRSAISEPSCRDEWEFKREPIEGFDPEKFKKANQLKKAVSNNTDGDVSYNALYTNRLGLTSPDVDEIQVGKQ